MKTLFKLEAIEPDIVYTPNDVALNIVRFLNPSGTCLDPCSGDGAFFKNLPSNSDYCEIQEGKDFFDYDKKVDWIIGNPPYSIFYEFLEHSFSISKNVSFLVPTNKVFQRQVVMDLISKWGGTLIISIRKRSASRVPFWLQRRKFSFQKII